MTTSGDIEAHLRNCSLAKTSHEKGQALQALAEHLFARAEGFEVIDAQRISEFRAEEVDLSIYQNPSVSGAHFIDAFFLVECKNRQDRIPSNEVSWFIQKLRSRKQTFGILIALNGIAGDPSVPSAAHFSVATALGEGIRVIVFQEEDVRALEGSGALVELMKQKLGRLLTSYEI